ncbi:hypothetical protein FRB96_001710 [Tulasnella sp. 330]|nr:hypothetical protein FRB96_001710 [Tulasnella sp. 330]
MSDISKFKSSLFGSRRDFWSKYDAFAVTYNRDMMEYLNTNLDVMLIFAGLFSAINTAFIVVALNALSANPADETNHLLRLLVMNVSNSTLTESDLTPPLAPTTSAVRQNCTFFASLCCSLLAAAGAVLAKQWMQFNGRTGQKGPFEQQAIWRTKKFVGAEKWKLGAVVETLATLLLMSLALCFIALVDYLWTVEETVTIVVMAFAASGAYLYITMVVVAAIISACPFQTGPSAALQRLRPTLERAPELRDLVFNKGWELLSAPFTTSKTKLQSLHAHSAIYIAESAPYPDNLLTVSENIPLITDFDSIRLFSGASSAFQSLLSQLRRTLYGSDNAGVLNAITLARAITHVVLVDPKRTNGAIQTFFSDLVDIKTDSSWFSTSRLNRWNEGHMNLLVEDICEVFLLEDLTVDAAYLSMVMSALMVIMEWYPHWGSCSGRTFVDDGKSLKDAWSSPLE